MGKMNEEWLTENYPTPAQEPKEESNGHTA